MGKRNDNWQLIADKLVIKLSTNACTWCNWRYLTILQNNTQL